MFSRELQLRSESNNTNHEKMRDLVSTAPLALLFVAISLIFCAVLVRLMLHCSLWL